MGIKKISRENNVKWLAIHHSVSQNKKSERGLPAFQGKINGRIIKKLQCLSCV